MELSQEEFLIQHLTEDKSYPTIAETYEIPREKLTKWWNTGTELRLKIKKSNQLFSSRKGKEEFREFEEIGKRGFFEWYSKQPRKCAYCGIEEYKLEKLFDKKNGILNTKRGRGKTLELERKDTLANKYSKENCVLACYLCNNHKSDLITEQDHSHYFAQKIKGFLDDKFKMMEQ